MFLVNNIVLNLPKNKNSQFFLHIYIFFVFKKIVFLQYFLFCHFFI